MNDADALARHTLLFDIRRSVRYHTRRRSFFDRWNLTTNAVAVIFGSATILGVLSSSGQGLAIAAAGIVTVFSSIDLVVGTTRMARLHEDLARRFFELEKAIVAATEITGEREALFTAQRLDIEACEPPILRVLDSICHNEMMRAFGYPPDHPEYVTISPWQRLWAHLFDWREHTITRRGMSPLSS